MDYYNEMKVVLDIIYRIETGKYVGWHERLRIARLAKKLADFVDYQIDLPLEKRNG